VVDGYQLSDFISYSLQSIVYCLTYYLPETSVEWIQYFFDLFIHLDRHLEQILVDYGTWTYLILFVVIFCETGLVVTPFLPGDSLLFAAGAFASRGLNPYWLFALLSLAAIAGDTVNYWAGHYIGPKAFSGNIRFLKKEHLDRTHRFYEKYGGKTIVLARFIPIIRTFAPFVAGIGAMNYGKFIIYNIVGGIAWVALFVFAGYWFGSAEFVKRNFHLVILAIIIISVMPMVYEYLRSRGQKAEEKP
jgi:membrane-associated protein